MSEDTDVAQLNRRSMRGGMIAIASQAMTVGLQLVSTVVLARMLTPDDYGVMGMVLSVVSLAALFKDLGLSSAAVQKANLTVEQQSNLFWINALFGLFLTMVFAASAPLVAWFFGRSELQGLTLVLSLTFILGGLSAQHNAMLVRHMRFGLQAIVNISAISATFTVSIGLAYLGYGFWALGWGHVAGAAVRTLLTWVFSPFVPSGWKRGTGMMDMVKFGANVTGFNFVNYFSRNLDNILIGKFVGADALGVYGRAYQLMMMPVMNLRAPIDAVTYPALCRLQGNPAEWRRYHMQTLRVLSFLTMPLVAWMFLVSEPLILIMLGERWADVVPIFRILVLVAFIQPSASMVGSVMLSLGLTRRYFWQGAAMAAFISAAFVIGINWGAQGVAWAYAGATYLALIPMLWFTYRGTELAVVDFFSSISVPATISLASVGAAAWIGFTTDFSSAMAEILWLSLLYFGAFVALTFALPGGRRELANAVGFAKYALARPRRDKS